MNDPLSSNKLETFPLPSLTLEEAKQKQFQLVDIITRHFKGNEILDGGDLGLVKGLNKPMTTEKVEQVLADFFNVEDAILVRGSGTAAIKWGLYSILKESKKRTVLVHQAPIYPTTKVILDMMSANIISTDYNNLETLIEILSTNEIDVALVQYTRQRIDDHYQMDEVLHALRSKNIPIVTDDNYAVMKVSKIGVELGATLSAFSTFKLLGPEGIGCIVGKKSHIADITKLNYSGGGQVQGHEALEVLRGLIYAPVSLAIQAEVNDKLLSELKQHTSTFVKNVYLVNAQSKVIIVEFYEAISEAILQQSVLLGALPHPVGAESKYEFCPLFYRVSGTFRESDPTLEKRMIRINPNRSGPETIIRILQQSYEAIEKNGHLP